MLERQNNIASGSRGGHGRHKNDKSDGNTFLKCFISVPRSFGNYYTLGGQKYYNFSEANMDTIMIRVL